MAILKMKHLRMVAMSSDREDLLQILQRMGCVEIDEPSVDPDDPVWAGLNRPLDTGGLSQARDRYTAAERAMEVLASGIAAYQKKVMRVSSPSVVD